MFFVWDSDAFSKSVSLVANWQMKKSEIRALLARIQPAGKSAYLHTGPHRLPLYQGYGGPHVQHGMAAMPVVACLATSLMFEKPTSLEGV